jgi:glutathione-specific gamma-glutamylcyclotransferase
MEWPGKAPEVPSLNHIDDVLKSMQPVLPDLPAGPGTPLSADQLARSLAATVDRWIDRRCLWVFGYGSLMWKPEFRFDMRLRARVFGYHRRLCLRSIKYRGTADRPGLVAGLDRGGSCLGIAYRICGSEALVELERLWQREMFMGSYAAHWLRVRTLDENRTVQALAFVVRQEGSNYCSGLSDDETVRILRSARGLYGSSLEYLHRTVESLRENRLQDRGLERLVALVEDADRP